MGPAGLLSGQPSMQTSILVTDDHLPARYLRGRVLREAGFAVLESDSAQTTIEAVRERAGDLALVLLDVGLPDGDGFDVCQNIKATHPALPVVLVSAVYRTAHARRDGLDAGAAAYLVDPTPPQRLVETVRRLTTAEKRAEETAEAVLRTTSGGVILWVNDRAAALLNIGERAAPGRSLLTFMNGDRGRIQGEMLRAAAGQVCDFEAPLRPRDRKPLMIRFDLAPALDGCPGELEWVVTS